MNRPLVVLTAFYIAGILIGELTGFKASAALALASFCFLAAVAGHILAWRENRRVVLSLFLLLGLALSRLAVEESDTALVKYAGQRVVLTGQVAAEPDVREDKVFYLLQAREILQGGESRAVSGELRLQVKESNRIYGYGDVLRVSGMLARPEPAGNPGGFDYRTYLERHGIRVGFMARGDAAVQKIGEGAANPALAAALRVKQKLSTIATASLTPSQAAILNGIVFGSQGLIDKETRQAFTETGVVHILSVSGLHVGLLLGGMVGLLRLLRLPPWLTAPLTTPVLIFYALMTGLIAAVLRATIMALLFLWAHHLGRDRDWPTTLALSALLILLWNPLQLFDPGFQLSYAATWGILYLGPLLTGVCTGLLNGLPANYVKLVAQALAIPLAAQLATVPLVVWYYNLVSPVSIPANLLAVPLVGVVLLLGLFATVLGLVWLPLAGLVNAGTGAALDLFLALIGFFQRLPGAVIYLATPPVLLAAAWYGGLLAVAKVCSGGWDFAARQRVKGWAAVGAVLAVALLLIWWPWGWGQKLTVHFLDVGQGDSILVQTPGGKNMLVDTGGRREEFQTGAGAGDQVVVPYLRKIGVKKLDALVLTHPHEDHAGGASAVVKSLPVGLAVVTPSAEAESEGGASAAEKTAAGSKKRGSSPGEEIPAAYTALLNKMATGGIPVRAASAGDSIRLDSRVAIEVISPEETAGEAISTPNNSSLVLKLTYGRRSFLLPGDVEVEAQKGLLQQEADLKADVLKLPHHGSRSLLPELVERVNPEEAVISVGAHNTFGHPAQSTLDLLYQSGAQIYRTDQNGAVIFETDGNKLTVRTGKGN